MPPGSKGTVHPSHRELLAAWRANPSPGGMVAVCNELATHAERRPGALAREAALALGAEAEAAYANDFEVLLAVGRLYLASGELHRALKPLIEAARIASEPRALRFLGEVFLRLGDARHASMSFERAIKRGANDPETHGWHESAKGYLPIQEAHGAEYVARLVEKAQRLNPAADHGHTVEDAETTSAHRRFPSEEIPDLGTSDDDADEKTDVLTMSRVVAAIQGVPADARGDFNGILRAARERSERDSLSDLQATVMRQAPAFPPEAFPSEEDSGPVDFDLDRDGLDLDGPTPGMDEPTAERGPSFGSSPPGHASSALAAATSRLANAASAPPPGLSSAASGARAPAPVHIPPPARAPVVNSEPPPKGPVSATSDRIIPVKLDAEAGGAEPAKAAAPSAPPPPKLEPAPVVTVARNKRSGRGAGLIGGLAVVTLLGSVMFGVRTGRLPALAEMLPEWLSGTSAPSVARDEPGSAEGTREDGAEVGAADPPDDGAVDDGTSPTIDPSASAEPEGSAEPAASASVEPEASASAEASAEPSTKPVAPPPPPAPLCVGDCGPPPKAPPPPPKAPPPKAPPPPPKAPPPKAPPPPPKAPPPPPPGDQPDPDVVWLGDPELKVQ